MASSLLLHHAEGAGQMKTLQLSANVSASLGGGVSYTNRMLRGACLALAFVLTGSAAFAEPVRAVTTGDVYTGNYDTGFNLNGTDFSFMVSQWLDPIVNCGPCSPGAVFEPSTRLAVSDWDAGRASFEGRTHESVYYNGWLEFDAGSVIVPDMAPGESGPDSEGLRRLFTTFTLTGTLAGFADPSATGAPLFSTGLKGSGLVAVAFSNYPPSSGIRVLQLDYHIANAAPVPEPGSLFLLGSGAAWIAARWRRREAASTR
jgi:hypothetical protein